MRVDWPIFFGSGNVTPCDTDCALGLGYC